MLLSVLRLTPKKWADLLKDNDHKMPTDAAEFTKVKKALARERIFEEQVFDLTRASSGGKAGSGGKNNKGSVRDRMPGL